MEKIKYLYFNPYVYVKCDREKCLIYNTENKKVIYVNGTKEANIVRRVYDYKHYNYYVTKLTSEEYDTIKNTVAEVESTGSGGIIERDSNENQPVIIPPVIRVSNTILNYDTESREYLHDIKRYIHNFHIFLNTSNGNRSNVYFTSYKQFDSPKYSNCKQELDYSLLKEQLENLDYPPKKIILSGSNIFEYPKFKELTIFLFEKFDETVIVFICDINDYVQNKNFFTNLTSDNYYIKLYVVPDYPFVELLQNIDLQTTILNFIVSSESDVEYVLNEVEKLQLSSYNLLPFYTGDNLSFFRENVFVEEQDVLNKHDIFDIASKEVINKQLFGNVYVLENGDIKLNPNTKKIGNIKENDIYLSMYNSFAKKETDPWFLTREQVEPCKDCIYSKLCPSISNYELFLNKFKICKIYGNE